MPERRGSARSSSLARRLLWFVGLWLAGVVTVGGLAWILKLVLTP